MSSIQLALSRLIEEALQLTEHHVFFAEYDPDWRSSWELPRGTGTTISNIPNQIPWKPVAQEPKVDFSGLENALETAVHPDLVEYFSSYWSGGIETKSIEGHASLIQLWNKEDFDRLIENYIGHSLAKRRLKEPLTFFLRNHRSRLRVFPEHRQ